MTAPTLKATTDPSAHTGAPAAPSTNASLESAILGTYKRAPIELVRGRACTCTTPRESRTSTSAAASP